MIPTALKFGFSILTSKAGLVGLALSLALGWHYIDKAAAVRSAEQAVEDHLKIDQLTKDLDLAMMQAARARAAQNELAAQVIRASEAAAEAELELEEYEANSTINPNGVVDGSVLERLRNR